MPTSTRSLAEAIIANPYLNGEVIRLDGGTLVCRLRCAFPGERTEDQPIGERLREVTRLSTPILMCCCSVRAGDWITGQTISVVGGWVMLL